MLIYCGNYFTTCVCHTIVLYTLTSYSAIYQLQLSKMGGKLGFLLESHEELFF